MRYRQPNYVIEVNRLQQKYIRICFLNPYLANMCDQFVLLHSPYRVYALDFVHQNLDNSDGNHFRATWLGNHCASVYHCHTRSTRMTTGQARVITSPKTVAALPSLHIRSLIRHEDILCAEFFGGCESVVKGFRWVLNTICRPVVGWKTNPLYQICSQPWPCPGEAGAAAQLGWGVIGDPHACTQAEKIRAKRHGLVDR